MIIASNEDFVYEKRNFENHNTPLSSRLFFLIYFLKFEKIEHIVIESLWNRYRDS